MATFSNQSNSTADKYCTFLINTEKSSSVQQEDICKDLESSNVTNKIRGIKNAITALLAGENMPKVLMTVIRYCITNDDHQIKKLLMIYWEIVPKVSADGKLLPEMILVCNALRNDLISPNEFVRGCMLRFLCKLKEAELLEPLIPSIKVALEHRHSYVRRNAALAVFNIHKTFGDNLLPEAAELMDKFIRVEGDVSARRNAFLMLFNEAEDIAIEFLSDHIDDIHKYGDGFALLVLELARKTCRRDPAQKSRFVRCLFQLLQSDSHAVSYESAWSLVSLSSAPTAVRACTQTYTKLLGACSDNNVKLIILDRLFDLKKHHSKIVQEMIMDILRALASPNIDISKKVLTLVVDMVSPRNIEEVIQVLKREVVRTQETDMESRDEYKTLLIQTIHKCATRFAEVADSVVLVLLDFLSGDGGYDVVACVKSIVEQYPSFRSAVLRKVVDNLDEITTSIALRGALWLLGEYCDVVDGNTLISDAFTAVRSMLGDSPFLPAVDESSEVKREEQTTTVVTKNVVLPDGTYASVTSTEVAGGVNNNESLPFLRRLVIGGDVLLGCVACACLTKMTLKASMDPAISKATYNNFLLNTLLTCTGVGKFAELKANGCIGINADSMERISSCCRILLDPIVTNEMKNTWLNTCREAFGNCVANAKLIKSRAAEKNKVLNISQADDLIQFRQLRAQAVQAGIEVDLMDADDISRAVGSENISSADTKLKQVHQLTGISDPVYCEASITVHDYDIILDMLVINRTPNTLTNLTVELATIGDLKLVERPQTHTIGPLDERRLKANIKVSSTETGHIFGTIVFDQSSNSQKTYVNLSDIQLNIMDYIRPAECRSEEFRSMWAAFEWENKVVINTNITSLNQFMEHIIANTNMTCLTPIESSVANSDFLAANLYAKSVFGEDALVNVSVERKEEGEVSLSGYIRIRSKTQGIALSLGDRISVIQRIMKPIESA